jgi:hypothetical protein
MAKINQRSLVKKHLNRKGHITSWEAIKLYGCTRLSSVIYDIRNEGMKIKTEYETKKNRYGYTVSFAKYIRER